MSPESEQKSPKKEQTVTALDYIRDQELLEKTAGEIMPYDPETCTYTYGPIRQILFSCLTCTQNSEENVPNCVCYSCSIQCHGDHELVELFTKRDFCCDCGTTRMKSNGCCKLRYKPEGASTTEGFARRSRLEQVWKEIKAEDIACSSNEYNHNFKGKFCDCDRVYDPSSESGNMIQCNFGVVCGEDWFHEECVLGLRPGAERSRRDRKFKRKFADGVNVLDMLPEAEDEASSTTEITKEKIEPHFEEPEPMDGFPDLEAFEGFVCWKCVSKYQSVFDKLLRYKNVCLDPVYHVAGSKSLQVRDEALETPAKKLKSESRASVACKYPYSIFLKDEYQSILKDMFIEAKKVPESVGADHAVIKEFLLAHKCLFDDEPVYEPPEDEDLKSESGSSLFSLGSKVLETLPRDQAVEGVHAYQMVKTKLREFLKPFADKGEVVTEDKIRSFFEQMNEKMLEDR